MRPRTFVFFLILQSVSLIAQPDDPFRYNNRGVAFLEQYEFRPASEEFRKALEARSNFIPARVNLGIAYYYLADYPKAAEQFREALKQDPKQPHAHFMLGLIVGKEKNRDEAFQHFREVLAIDPDDPATHYNLGLLSARNREYDAAIASFKKVLEVEPYHVSALYNLAMALMRSGKQDESRQVMARFQQLKSGDQAGGPMGAMGVQYAEEGKYALGIGQYEPLAAQSAQQLSIRFVQANADAGVRFVHAGPGKNPIGTSWKRADYSPEEAQKTVVPGFGSGSAFLDFDKDGKMDLFVVNATTSQGTGNTLYRNVASGKFQDVSAASGLGLKHLGMGAAVGDFNNDTYPDLFVTGYGGNHLFRNDKNGRFTDVTQEAGITNSPTRWSLSAAFFDFDHDGDLDIYVTNFVDLTAVPQKETFVFPDDFTGQENQLLRNNGNGTFADVAAQAQVTGSKAKSTSVIFLDYNNSRDIDILVMNQGAAPNLFSNKRDGTFEDVSTQVGLTASKSAGASSADVNKDSYQDLVLPGFALPVLKNSVGRKFVEPEPGTAPQPAFAWSSTVFDYDNDGWLDLLVLQDKARLLKNQGARGFIDVSDQCGLAALQTGSGRSAAIADYDGDGDNDIFVTVNGGKPLLLRNDGANQNRSLQIDLAGLRDNKGGLGAKVEIRAGQAWQKLEINGNVGFLSQSSPELVFGIGKKQLADSIRILWPTGVLQAELDRQAGQPVKIEEVDRKGTSCPLLYAWNGLKYDFVTDFLGGSAVGYLVAPGTYGSTDVDEYIRIADVAPQPKDGRYSIKMNNQLEEVMFIDQVKLLAVDHPADTAVYPDEKLMPAPPYPAFKVFLTQNSKPPVKAVDERGKDVLPALVNVDRKYPDSFKLLPFKGYAEPHELILELGDMSQAERVVLLLTAWIDYADSSSNLAASQAGAKLVPPYLQVVDQQGCWVTVLSNMGFPAGLPKTMTVDLSGKLLNKQDSRVKIVTSMRIYWDQILVDTYSGPTAPRVTTLGADRAGFEFYGYPREVKPDGKNPPQYDYHDRSTTSPWKNHIGRYTRYGDVRPLLEAKDDMYVIMRHGDEITAEFEAVKLPELPEGWTRTFLVYAAGFGKDMDLNSANADTVGPLPSHSGMYPTDSDHQKYQKKYNTREVGETFNW
ncbi:MAG: tetratricopeptide repeat protein [Acidobacteria bacterium]|nr:MAG: tetratricopeptide repeat protein [Acidobacteriota bacterium]